MSVKIVKDSGETKGELFLQKFVLIKFLILVKTLARRYLDVLSVISINIGRIYIFFLQSWKNYQEIFVEGFFNQIKLRITRHEFCDQNS